MKKLTTVFAGLVLFISVSAFAPKNAFISTTLKTIFEKDFSTASNVKWEIVNDLYVATFQSKGTYLTAAYDETGELLAVAKYVKISELPSQVTSALEKKYAGYAINLSAIEIAGETTSYLIDVQDDKYKFRVKSDALGNLSIDSRTKK